MQEKNDHKKCADLLHTKTTQKHNIHTQIWNKTSSEKKTVKVNEIVT